MPTHSTKIITILIADDHEMTRKGIRKFLSHASDMKVVGEASNEDQIKKLVGKLHPRILLLDLVMPDFSPSQCEKWVRTNYPETITLVLTDHDRDSYLSSMVDAGVAGYLDKKLRAGQLISAIRRAAHGEILFTKEQLDRVIQWRKDVTIKWESLSGREREILQHLIEGEENKKIGQLLGITVNTVEKHLENIYKKLGVNSRTEAIHWWVEKITDFRN